MLATTCIAPGQRSLRPFTNVIVLVSDSIEAFRGPHHCSDSVNDLQILNLAIRMDQASWSVT